MKLIKIQEHMIGMAKVGQLCICLKYMKKYNRLQNFYV